MYRIGVDIGGTKIAVGVFDAEKQLIASEKYYIAEAGDLPSFIKNSVERLCGGRGISLKELAACGAAVPGTVDGEGRKIIKAPNIKALSENFARDLELQLGFPVKLVQDSRAAAWGEYVAGYGQGKSSVVCVTLGTGIGTGIVLSGKVYDGGLGCAGELGHTPVAENGRPCGCGKNGCLEKYCAGGGLDITAAELLGGGKTAADLLDRAEAGDSSAEQAVGEAVRMLGRALVSLINLLSPDCLLFSGGLSARETSYINPLIKYIRTHCYKADKLPFISKAKLGEKAPLYGAAFLPIEDKRIREPKLSASIMCADILEMRRALREIEEADIRYVHCDIMDNHFVPNLMLPMELLNKLRAATRLPFDYHIMADDAESVIEKLTIRENDIVSVHFEATPHLIRAISLIKEKGAKASVAINPSTPVEFLSEVLSELDMVLVMTVNPGFAGQKIVPFGFNKIKRVRDYLDSKGLKNTEIEADGNCSFENVPKMYEAGANIFVVGTSSVFGTDTTVRAAAKRLYESLK